MLLAGPPHRQSVWTGPGLSGDWLMFGRHQPGTSSKNDQRTRTPSLHSTPPTCAAAFWHRLLWVFETNINLLNSDRERERERDIYRQIFSVPPAEGLGQAQCPWRTPPKLSRVSRVFYWDIELPGPSCLLLLPQEGVGPVCLLHPPLTLSRRQ